MKVAVGGLMSMRVAFSFGGRTHRGDRRQHLMRRRVPLGCGDPVSARGACPRVPGGDAAGSVEGAAPSDGGRLVARIEPIPMDKADGKARALLGELVQRGGSPGRWSARWPTPRR